MKQRSSSSSHSSTPVSSSAPSLSKAPTLSELDETPSGAHVAVIVLGDTGRSPRMQYHALSFSNLSPLLVREVTLIGYAGEKCNDLIQNKKNIRDLR
jgi:hypothetical protein